MNAMGHQQWSQAIQTVMPRHQTHWSNAVCLKPVLEEWHED